MKKKFISVVLCAAMAAGVLAGCGAKSSESKSEKTSDGKTKVRMTYWNSEDTVKTLLEYLEKEVPDVTVEFQFIDNSNYDIHSYPQRKDRILSVNHRHLH